MLSEHELERVGYEIDTLGFAVVENVVDRAFAARMRSELLAAIEEDKRRWQVRPQKTYDLIVNLVEHGGVFLELLENAIMRQVFARFLSDTCILYNYSSTFLLPRGSPGTLSTHVDSPRVIPNYHSGLIMTLALDDFTADNGATVYLPGSQSHAATPDEATFARYCVSTARSCGAGLFFNPRCFHRALPNRTNDIRAGVTVFAVRAYMKPRFDYPRHFQPAAAQAMSARLRQFLGFDARVPVSTAEYYVDASDRLYKPGQG